MPDETQSEEQSKSTRRQDLVLAAFNRIAESGFEGLRTRDVAADAGVNVATLHYYFPTKEALIRGVVGHAMLRFSQSMPREGSAAQQLRWHLTFLRRLLKEDTQLFAVVAELTLRAPRDPVIAGILRNTDEPWHRKVAMLLQSAVEQGCIDAGIDPEEGAAFIIAAVKGLSLPGNSELHQTRIDQTFDQLERWLGLAMEES